MGFTAGGQGKSRKARLREDLDPRNRWVVEVPVVPEPDENQVEILRHAQQEARETGRTLTQEEESARKWGGLAFGAGDLLLVTELTSIVDVLFCPAVTPVPGTKPWIMGICNVRGKLYSVVDLGLFLGVSPRASETGGRLLVVNNEDLGCTLFVPRVLGLRYFREDRVKQDKSGVDEGVLPYVDRVYDQDDRTWLVVSLERLVSDKEFLSAGRTGVN